MMATQVLVWETVVGERDADFNHVDPGLSLIHIFSFRSLNTMSYTGTWMRV